MSLELMQMRMNNIADKIEELSEDYYTKWICLPERADNYEERMMLLSQKELLSSLGNIIREEMKIEHY